MCAEEPATVCVIPLTLLPVIVKTDAAEPPELEIPLTAPDCAALYVTKFPSVVPILLFVILIAPPTKPEVLMMPLTEPADTNVNPFTELPVIVNAQVEAPAEF